MRWLNTGASVDHLAVYELNRSGRGGTVEVTSAFGRSLFRDPAWPVRWRRCCGECSKVVGRVYRESML